MNTVTIYKCFVASPNDTTKERKVCDEVFEYINKTLGQQFNFRIESIRWEKDASPSFGDSPQDVINKQLFKDIDLFIGILYSRFGTPTINYNSGTEEEFYQAYERYSDSPGSIEIKMYFNDAHIKPSKLKLEELDKIKKFKERVKKLGGLYKCYNGVEKFKETLNKDLTKYLLEKHNIQDSNNSCNQTESITLIKDILSQRLKDALSNFEDQNVTWIDRSLCKTEELDKKEFENIDKIESVNLIDDSNSKLIYGKPQFGLTCLSHYLVLKAWEKGFKWIYLDAEKCALKDYEQLITKECKVLGIDTSHIQCIVLDSWFKSGHGMTKLLRFLCNKFPKVTMCVMSSYITDLSQEENNKIKRHFEHYTLLPLTQNKIRGIIENYDSTFVVDNNRVLKKVVKDLDTLNIHRTPLNCLTLLKIAEKNFNDPPVNRTKMVGMILTLMFDFTKYPTYSTKPDVEHCEFLLGYFCERLIKERKNSFTKNEFTRTSIEFIEKKKIDLDVQTVFNTLFNNRIIIEDESACKFRHVYWIYYFAAKRMHLDSKFYKYIIDSKQYSSSIEIIDFYTGINRHENDLIQLLTRDIKNECDTFENDIGLGFDFNPLDNMKWVQTEEDFKRTYSKIKSEILNSNLSEVVKDEYADKNYDFKKPDNQDLSEICEQYSLMSLMQKIHVCSRALRNSEFIEPDKKTNLLNGIIRAWQLVSKLLFVLTPILAKKDKKMIILDGVCFYLSSEFHDKPQEEKFNMILAANPSNIVRWFQDDLHSERLSPILEEKLNSEKNSLIKHMMIVFILNNNLKDWKSIVFNYIKLINKNSFYLFDIYQQLLHVYEYHFLTDRQLSEVKDLIEITYAKKTTNSKNLIDTAKSIKQPPLPSRSFKDE